MKEKGFLLLEALVSILILSVALAASLTGIAQVLRLKERADETTKAIVQFDNLLFQLEAGMRTDLLRDGGRGKIGEFDYDIRSETVNSENTGVKKDETEGDPAPFLSFRNVKSHLSWKNGKEFLDIETFLPEVILS